MSISNKVIPILWNVMYKWFKLSILHGIQEVFHVYLNKFENAVTNFSSLYLVIIDFRGLV